MSAKPAVLFFSRDPGATNQLVAVHELLCRSPKPGAPAIQALRQCLGLKKGECPEAAVLGRQFALDVWRAAGIEAEEHAATVPESLLKERDIALVVTGTDDIDEPDTVDLWRTAQRAGIPVAVFLDNLVNLDVRFRTREGTLITPDLVFALDRPSSDTLAEAGIPEDRLHVTENLHLARLARLAERHKDARASLRAAWGADDDARVVLFAAENTAEMAALGRPAPWDEHLLLRAFTSDLAIGRPLGGVDPAKNEVVVVIRPHPRDPPGKYDGYRREEPPRILISSQGTPLEAILAADLVVGMDSALLFEARALGRRALSFVQNSKFNALTG
ncbi:MAG: hypothetical protein RIB59_09970 [Rhodospirillales bacterium]